jgi:hypothetical protein
MKYYEMIATRNFFRNGKLILKGEIIDCDEEAKNQMLQEELMEFTRVGKAELESEVKKR